MKVASTEAEEDEELKNLNTKRIDKSVDYPNDQYANPSSKVLNFGAQAPWCLYTVKEKLSKKK
jgi:hypothetical protein